MEPVVLVHLSDIHFTAAGDSEAFRHESTRLDLVHDLEKMRHEVGDATAVVVTGDIAFSGSPEQYAVAGTWLDKTAKTVGTDEAMVLTVPGNHDVDCSVVGPSAALAHQHLRDCPRDDLDRELQALLDDPARPLLTKLANYNNFAARYGCEVPANGRPWEALIPLPGGYTLAVTGLCSVFNSDRQDQRRLLLGKGQTTLLGEKGKVYLLLAHHGPGDLRDGDDVRDKIRDRAVALLTGHRHDQRVLQANGCLEVTAGAVNPEEETGWFPSYNWLRITLVDEDATVPRVRIELWHRQWRPAWNGFGSASRDGGVECWEVAVGEQARLPAAPAPAPGSAPDTTKGATDLGGLPADTGAGPESVAVPEAGPEPRPPLLEEHQGVPDERRIRHALFALSPPVQYGVLNECGLLADEDWTKDYVSMLVDAVGTAAARSALGRLDAAVRAAAQEKDA